MGLSLVRYEYIYQAIREEHEKFERNNYPIAALCKLQPVSAEGIGIYHIRTCINILSMYIYEPLGLFKVHSFGSFSHFQPLSLQHSTHCAVKDNKFLILQKLSKSHNARPFS